MNSAEGFNRNYLLSLISTVSLHPLVDMSPFQLHLNQYPNDLNLFVNQNHSSHPNKLLDLTTKSETEKINPQITKSYNTKPPKTPLLFLIRLLPLATSSR